MRFYRTALRLFVELSGPLHWRRSTFGGVLTLSAITFVFLGSIQPLTAGREPDSYFRRIATFPIFLNTCNGLTESAYEDCVDEETVAEIVAASQDGRVLVYTDGETENLGFVDISNPYSPQPAGLVPVGGEPTSVAVSKDYALVAVNTSDDYINTSGHLAVVHLSSQMIVRTIDLGGQPDSVAVSPNNRFAAVAIENERNEDICVGGTHDGKDVVDEPESENEVTEDDCELGGGKVGVPPQAPPGYLVIVDLAGQPSAWTKRVVDLVGVPGKFPTDPEPEFVDISNNNIAVVTLQENNWIVLVHLPTGSIINSFSAGETSLEEIDTIENGLIELTGSFYDLPREPDAVAWISNSEFVTADEGDLEGGTRGFTIFGSDGAIHLEAGNSLEHLVTQIGHYPEERSENKGNEPEGAEFGKYGSNGYLFIGSERSSVVAVYRVGDSKHLEFVQVLPAGLAPEGLLAIPRRNLFVVASEDDDRGDKYRSSLTIFKLGSKNPAYPTVFSGNRTDGLPIPWGALSGIAPDLGDSSRCYTVYDSFYSESRIFAVEVSMSPALITDEIVLKDGGQTVNKDPEGVATRVDGGFWVVSEGSGSIDDPNRPVQTTNQLLRVADDGTIQESVELPDSVNALQRRFGFEGVASVGSGDDELVYVAFQREWIGDPVNQVRIGRYRPSSGEWKFFYYPLDPAISPNGGWVGLSEIAALSDTEFAVVERDNQAGPDARIKRVYRFSVEGIEPEAQGGDFPLLSKVAVRDLIPDLQEDNGLVIEKVEGLAILANGDTVIVTDNDGVDDSSGETQFINLGRIFH
jgi:hypothetical protein